MLIGFPIERTTKNIMRIANGKTMSIGMPAASGIEATAAYCWYLIWHIST
ncbi:MAG: hypothetical protein AB9856_18920 [Cellulosilyticaceae bacterium]